MSMSEIQPIRPIAPYLGGKKNLARRLCAIIDRDQHEAYAQDARRGELIIANWQL